ncbi:MAG: PIG-L family deacetylase, partial [Candidatus Omnitrophica bacterium]|nr:PIG-L family deacetylase [Candidatus Omnitrophota bacterium]
GYNRTGIVWEREGVVVFSHAQKRDLWHPDASTEWITDSMSDGGAQGAPLAGVSRFAWPQEGQGAAFTTIRPAETLHHHPVRDGGRQQTELYLVMQGRAGLLVIQEGTAFLHVMRAGDMALLHPGVSHQILVVDGPYEHLVAQVPSTFQYGFWFKENGPTDTAAFLGAARRLLAAGTSGVLAAAHGATLRLAGIGTVVVAPLALVFGWPTLAWLGVAADALLIASPLLGMVWYSLSRTREGFEVDGVEVVFDQRPDAEQHLYRDADIEREFGREVIMAFSPHADDVLFRMGGLANRIIKTQSHLNGGGRFILTTLVQDAMGVTDASLVHWLTGRSVAESEAQDVLRTMGMTDDRKFQLKRQMRQQEDEAAANALGLSKKGRTYYNLDLDWPPTELVPEASYRTTFQHPTPTDLEQIRDLLDARPDVTMVFLPLPDQAVEPHQHHRDASIALLRVLRETHPRVKLVFYPSTEGLRRAARQANWTYSYGKDESRALQVLVDGAYRSQNERLLAQRGFTYSQLAERTARARSAEESHRLGAQLNELAEVFLTGRLTETPTTSFGVGVGQLFDPDLWRAAWR